MRYTPSIRSALLGLSAAIAVLLIGFTPSGATAATHANAQQPRSIAAVHPMTSPASRQLPCGTVAQETGNDYGRAMLTPLNLRNGPMASCRVTGKVYKLDPLRYFCTSGGWTYLRDTWRGFTGWTTNNVLSQHGSKRSCGNSSQPRSVLPANHSGTHS